MTAMTASMLAGAAASRRPRAGLALGLVAIATLVGGRARAQSKEFDNAQAAPASMPPGPNVQAPNASVYRPPLTSPRDTSFRPVVVSAGALKRREAGAAPLVPISWRELWRVRVGRTGSEWDQIAVRGPLVVVASAGERAGPDPLDGIYVIDGRPAASRRIVRHVETGDDAFGVSLGQDQVVFATAREVRSIRLDGWSIATRPRAGRATPSPMDWLAGRVDVSASGPDAPLDRRAVVKDWLDARKQPPPIVISGLLTPTVDAWIESRDRPSPALIIEDQAGRRGSLPLPAAPVSRPSLGNLDGDDSWDLLVGAGEYLIAYTTGTGEPVGRAFWAGDVAASTRTPLFADNLPAYASRLPPRDTARWLIPDLAPSDAAFEPAPADAPARWAAPAHLQVQLAGHLIETEDATTCAGRSFAINEGHLARLDGREWRLIKGAPFPVARLACGRGDGALLVAMANGHGYRLAPPVRWQPMAWEVAAAIPIGLMLIAVYTRSRRPAASHAHDEAQVRHRFIADAPRGALAAAHPHQRSLVLGLMNFLDNDDTRPPVTVALYGKWGSGKSSIMKMLREQLKGTGRYIDVWFNAWRFHREEQLAPALLQSIVEEIGRQSDWVTRLAALADRIRTARVREVLLVGAMAGGALLSFFVFLRFENPLGWLSSIAALAAGLWQKVLNPLLRVFSLDPAKLLDATDSRKRIGFIREFGDEFQRVLRRLPKHARLIVFVDDLDRCPPDRIVDLLETLNMLADTGCGFFVVATDRDTVRRAVELVHRETVELLRQEDPQEARRYGERYLDKVVTVGINVPEVKPDELSMEDAAPPPLPSAMRQLAGAILTALRPRAAWAFAAAFVFAIGFPFWAAVRYLGGPEAALEAIESAVRGGAAPAVIAGGTAVPASVATATATKKEIPAAGAGSPSPRAALPGGGPALAASSRVGGAAKGGHRPTRDLSGWVGHDPAPVAAPLSPPPLITLETLRSPAAECNLALVLLRLVEGLGALVILILGGFFWAQYEQQRRIKGAQPIAHDSQEFSGALRSWTAKLPCNPRTTIRFNNAARFLYHVVGVSHRAEHGWERRFFQILFYQWMELPPAPPSEPKWLDQEMRVWIPAAPVIASAQAAE